MSRTLAEWLVYQERVNVHSIELGLDRVRAVWQRMGAPTPARHVITVGGTNGKGSTVAMLEAMLLAAELRTGSFTSPHLLHYNERVRIGGQDVDDASLIASFERIEAARTAGDEAPILLTYFEFGTLAALDLFARADLDVAVLEVGLGGRLDAVNIIDADVAVIVTVDLDHMEWLGPDRDSIGREKAGIARAGRPAIVGQLDAPNGLLDTLAERGALVQRLGTDFTVERHAGSWSWCHRDGSAMELPNPVLVAPVQFDNAAAAIAALHALWKKDDLDAPKNLFAAVTLGLGHVHASARLQSLGGDPALIVDVGHNPQAARALAEWLDGQTPARVHAVYGALADKDVAGVIAALGDRVDHWHLAGLEHETPRGLAVSGLAEILQRVLPQAPFDTHADVAAALAAARAAAEPGERILAFGSFFVARAVLADDACDVSRPTAVPTEPIAALRAQQVMGFVAGRYNHRLDAPRLPPWSEVLKTRLPGAAVIIALAVLFIPMFFSSAPPATVGDQAVSLTIPDSPDRDLQTKTMSLAVPPANTPAATVPGTVTPATPAASGDQLATVNIGSNRPRDVETDPEAGKPRTPTTVTMGSGTSPEQPVIPLQNKHAAGSAQTTPAANAKAAPVSKTPAAPVASVQQAAVSKAAVVAVAPATAAAAEHGNYTLNLSAYASAAGAAKLQGQVRALGYPAQSHLIQQAGQQRTLVIAGPFDTRTAAEAARLKITQTIPGAPARLEQNASHSGASVASQSAATTPSTAASKTASTKAGGWAVQLAAMSTQADADALRDKLRAGGFDGFVDSVQANGKRLWRVRAGPQAQRADAVRIHDQIKAKFAIDGNVVSVP